MVTMYITNMRDNLHTKYSKNDHEQGIDDEKTILLMTLNYTIHTWYIPNNIWKRDSECRGLNIIWQYQSQTDVEDGLRP